MPDTSCAVSRIIAELKFIIDSGRLKTPKSRRIAEEILTLTEDVAWGRAGDDHLTAITELSQQLIDEGDTQSCLETGKMVSKALDEYHEVFQSHVDTICVN